MNLKVGKKLLWRDRMTNYFRVGKIVNTHGLKGEVRIVSVTDFPDERYRIGNTLYVFFREDREGVQVTVKTHRKHKNFDLLSFEGFQDINDVEKFKGATLKVSEDQLNDLDEGEYYYYELIGCKVYNEKNELLGVVKEILSPGANDVWVVKPIQKGKNILIPYIPLVVKNVNIADKVIQIEQIEGLIE